MTNITRRAALGGLAAIPAAAMPVAAAAGVNIPDGKLEHIGERLARLTRELSDVLDEINAATFATDYGSDTVGIRCARVWPSRISKLVKLEQVAVPLAYAQFYSQVRS